jgi:lipopolysaccharide cholinephosphotransferase
MKEINLDELKVIQLDMLKFVKKFCEKNNLKYYLCGGTLLGAIRHKGFIPWDDDIDIFMPMNDYKKFIELFNENEKYRLLNPYKSKDYYYLFSKLIDNRTYLKEDDKPHIDEMGVYIDIFPICGLPDNREEIDKYITKINGLYKKHWHTFCKVWNYSDKKSKMIIKTIVKFPYYFLNRKKHIRQGILDLMEKYDIEKSKYVGYILSWYVEKEVTRKEVYDKTIQVEFEVEIFSAPAGYDEYLTNLYGNYMELPPVEKRVSNHDFKAYWR